MFKLKIQALLLFLLDSQICILMRNKLSCLIKTHEIEFTIQNVITALVPKPLNSEIPKQDCHNSGFNM